MNMWKLNERTAILILAMVFPFSAAAQGISYELIQDQKQAGVKRSVDVRIEARMTESELDSLAHEILKLSESEYPQTFILYYLPDMNVGEGAWASTHFRPDLVVEILGTSKEEYERLNKLEESADGEIVVGVWLDERPYVGSRLTLVKRGPDAILKTVYSDGSSRETHLVETKTSLGTRYGSTATSEDYYLLNGDGSLELRDSLGLIAKLKKVN